MMSDTAIVMMLAIQTCQREGIKCFLSFSGKMKEKKNLMLRLLRAAVRTNLFVKLCRWGNGLCMSDFMAESETMQFVMCH